MKVIVIGAGVAGLCLAHALQLRGTTVTVIDRATGPGQGASRGNGAQLSYAYVAPLAEPGVWGKLPSLLLDPDSPLRVAPRLDPAQWAWGLRFLQAANRRQAQTTTRALLALSTLSRQHIEAWIESLSIACHFTRGGKLVVYPDAASLAAAQAQVAFQRGVPGAHGAQQVLDRAACLAREPALTGYADRIAGGVWTATEAAADCGAFCDGLAAHLQRAGVTFVYGASVRALLRHRGAVVGVRTEHGNHSADAVVLANGSHAPALARTVGVALPVYPLKGYSITVPLARGERGPQVSITDTRRKVVFAPLGRRVRVAGFVELAGHNDRLPPARIDALVAATREVIGIQAQGDLQPWCGFRPATPTGLPILGASSVRGLWLNVGQGALGWTLAAGSAQVVTDAMLERTPTIDVAPFRYRT